MSYSINKDVLIRMVEFAHQQGELIHKVVVKKRNYLAEIKTIDSED